VGRKKVLVIGTVLLGFCLCLMGIFDYFSVNFVLPIIVVQVYLAIFVMSSGPICWIYCGEVLSDQGMTLCTAVNFVSNVIVVLIFPFLKEWVGYTTVFLVLGVVNFVGAGMLQGMMKETKGLMKDEIRDLFGKGKNYE
jgi:MFS family permease